MFDRKERALMIIIERIIARHHQGYACLDEEVFKLFELAKRIHYAENEAGFQAAVAGLGCAPEMFKPPLLSLIATIQVPEIKKFVAADAFGPNNHAGIKFFLGGNFKKNFLGKIEGNVEPATIAIHQLEKPSRDPEIMAELGPAEKKVIKLAYFCHLIGAQANGREGYLLANGSANIAYIEEGEGKAFWAVDARWGSFDGGWGVYAISVGGPDGWRAGDRVLSRK